MRNFFQRSGSIILLTILLLCLNFIPPVKADDILYFYDESGQLNRVIRGTSGLIYQYDDVGNLLSISNANTSSNPPLLQSIVPDIFFINSTTSALISGLNLLTVNAVTASNSSIGIKVKSVTDTSIRADLAVPANVPLGPVTITVTTNYGSANIQATVSSVNLSFSPGQLALLPGQVGTITARLTPPLERDVTIPVSSSAASVVVVPSTVTIPANGEISFDITALSVGIAKISSGAPYSVVFVSNSYTPQPGDDVYGFAKPISAFINSPVANNSNSVSAMIDTPVILHAPSVSGLINEPSQVRGMPVSAYIETGVTMVSNLVSALINAP